MSAPSGSTHHHTWPVLAKLQAAAEAWEPVAQRLGVVEGSSQLTVAQVRAQARRAVRQHQIRLMPLLIKWAAPAGASANRA